MSDKKTILLVDDHKIIREAIKLFFKNDTEFEVTAEAMNGQGALEVLKTQKFDIVITDINMPVMDGVALMEHIKTENPDQKVLVLSMMGEVMHINKMISLGANGYIMKDSSQDELKNAIRKITSGENHFSQEVYQAIINKMAGHKPKERLTFEVPLSDREKEIIKLITEEYSNQEIADKLFISVRTVDSHKRNILEKTGCKNIAGLVMYAVERQLI